MLKNLTFLMVIPAILMLISCNPEDEYLSKLYPKESRTYAIQGLKRMKGEIKNLDKTCDKLLKLDKTPEAGVAVLAAGELGCTQSVPRIGVIVDDCLSALNVRNLKTLESAAMSLGLLKNPEAVPILAKYFSINTPEQLAVGMREKAESVAKRAAIEALSKMPNESKHLVPEILKVFDSKIEDFGTKYTTAGVLGEWQEPSTVRPLVTALFYEEQGFSLFPEARKSLIRLGKHAEKELIEAYNGQNLTVNSIQNANKERATRQFCPEYLDNEEAKKKGECPKDDEFVATIASIDTTTKLKASMVLADIRSKLAVDMVIAELEAQLATDKKQPFLAEHLAVQLAKFGDFRATDTLLKMVSKKFTKNAVKKPGHKPSKEEIAQAKLADRGQEISIMMKGAEALAILGDPKAIPYLLELAKQKPISEYNEMNEKIIFYESVVWGADALTRMISDPTMAADFIKSAEVIINDGEKYVANVESKLKTQIVKETKGEEATPEELDKKVKAQARLDVNYDSTNKAVEMFKKFVARAKVSQECGKDTSCYAGKLKDSNPATVEKAVYMIGYSGEMKHYREQLKPVFLHTEPYVREALTVALLKTEDCGFVEIIEDVLSKEGDKVEHALAMREFKAIASYLSSLN
ncbi:MAG: HEAT repeat domain-containing protein [bacterium]